MGKSSRLTGLRHDAFFYSTADEYTARVGRFVAEAADAGEPVMVAVPERKLRLLERRLDGRMRTVTTANMDELGRNPACIIPTVRQFLDGTEAGSASFVGEPIWAGRTAAEVAEATRHESMLNAAFSTSALSILCPYDSSRLPNAVLGDAWRTHPRVEQDGGASASDRFTDPHAFCRAEAWPLEPVPVGAVVAELPAVRLKAVREVVQREAAMHGLSDEGAANLLLAVNEVATNSLVHAGGGWMRLWATDRGLVCEIRDQGHIHDLLAGRDPPGTDEEGRRGLWLANQLCDLVQIRSGPAGTAIRLHVSRRDLVASGD